MSRRRFTRAQMAFRGAMRPRRKKRVMTVQRVKKIISGQSEAKHVDVVLSADTAPIAGTGTVTPLSLIAEGDGGDERTGNSVFAYSLAIRGIVEQDATLSALSDICRLILIKVDDTDATLPTILEFLESDSIHGQRLFGSNKKYKVLWDKVINLRPYHDGTNFNIGSRFFKYYKRFKNPVKMDYNNNTAAIASTTLNHFFLVRITNRANLVQPVWTLSTRLIFKEN